MQPKVSPLADMEEGLVNDPGASDHGDTSVHTDEHHLSIRALWFAMHRLHSHDDCNYSESCKCSLCTGHGYHAVRGTICALWSFGIVGKPFNGTIGKPGKYLHCKYLKIKPEELDEDLRHCFELFWIEALLANLPREPVTVVMFMSC
jgi:hypothetical protein